MFAFLKLREKAPPVELSRVLAETETALAAAQASLPGLAQRRADAVLSGDGAELADTESALAAGQLAVERLTAAAAALRTRMVAAEAEARDAAVRGLVERAEALAADAAEALQEGYGRHAVAIAALLTAERAADEAVSAAVQALGTAQNEGRLLDTPQPLRVASRIRRPDFATGAIGEVVSLPPLESPGGVIDAAALPFWPARGAG